MITEAHPDHGAPARAVGTWAAVSSLALPAGPLLGGLLVAAGGWQLVFAVNVPVVIVALVAVGVVVPASAASLGRRVDLPGIVLVAIALGTAVATVIEVGHGGGTTRSAATLMAAIAATVGLVVWERRAPDPLPPDLLRSPAVLGPNLAAGSMTSSSTAACSC